MRLSSAQPGEAANVLPYTAKTAKPRMMAPVGYLMVLSRAVTSLLGGGP